MIDTFLVLTVGSSSAVKEPFFTSACETYPIVLSVIERFICYGWLSDLYVIEVYPK